MDWDSVEDELMKIEEAGVNSYQKLDEITDKDEVKKYYKDSFAKPHKIIHPKIGCVIIVTPQGGAT